MPDSAGQPSSQSTAPMPTTIGRYAILRKLGQGGMGAVYEAEHLRLEKRVALKVLPREVANDPAAIARFDREMKAISRVTHPGIIQALDADEADGVRYLAMELVDGYDVSEVAAYYEERAGKPIPLSVACEIIRQAAIAIQAAHDAGLVHRDLKPSNLMLGKDGTVKVLDLGLAMLDSKHCEEGGLTSTGQVMGTVDYMAPEQAAETRSVDSRADVYSLGATLYRLIAGKGPYPSDRYPSVIQKLMALANTDPTPLKELRSKCPAKLVALVNTAMAKDPGKRLPTAAELANALEPAGDREKLVELASKMPKRKPVDRSLLAETQVGSSIVDARGPVPDPTETRAAAETDNNAEATFVEATQSLGGEIPKFSVDETPNTLVGSGSGTSWSRKKKPPVPLWGWIAGGVVTLGIVIAVVSSSGSSAPPPKPNSLVLQPIESNVEVPEVVPSSVTSTNALSVPGTTKAPLGFWGDSDSIDEPTVNTKSTSTETTLQFSELEDTVVIPTLLDETDALTIELWMQRDSRLINAHTHIVGFDSQVVIGTEDASALAFKSGGSMVADTPESTATELGLPRPIHVAGVRDPVKREVRLYIDGKFVSHQTGKAALGIDALEIASAQYQWKPGNDSSEHHFRGWIGELRVSNSVRYVANFIPERQFAKDGNTLALYHFDEGSGDVLFDSSGNGHDGKIIGATWVEPNATAPGMAEAPGGFRDGGQRSSTETALHFTELEHNVRVPTLFDETPALTIEAWLQRDRLHSNAHSNIMGFGSGSIIGTGAIGDLSYRMRYGDDIVAPRNFSPASYGDSAHIACVRDPDSNELRLFIDGKLAGVTDVATYRPLKKGDDDYNYFEICSVAHQWGSERGSKAPYFSGWFDEVRISKSARYKDEFKPERRFESDSDTLALYHFEEGSGDILKDASGNGHDGTIIGAKWVGGAQAKETSPSVGVRSGNLFELQMSHGETDGRQSRVEIPTLNLNPSTATTLELFFTPGTEHNNVVIAGVKGGFRIENLARDHVQFVWGLQPDENNSMHMAVAETGANVHLAAVYTGKKYLTFCNGQLVEERAVTSPPVSSRGPFVLGGNEGDRLGPVRVSAVARYATDFVPPSSFENDRHTLALYTLEAGRGDVVRDATGNGHDGQVIGAEWVATSPWIDAGETTAIDLLREHGPNTVNRARRRADGSWSSTGDSKFEFDRPVRSGYTLTTSIKQNGGYETEIGLVLPIGDAQVELIIPDRARGKASDVVLNRVADERVSTTTASFPKGQSFRVVADVRWVNDTWHLYAKLDDEIIVNRDLDESELSVDELATLSSKDRIGIRLGGGAEFELESVDVVVHSDEPSS